MSVTTPPSTIAVVGRGRLGRVLATAFVQAGLTVHGPLGRDDVIPESEVALLCVPDAHIAEAAAAARPRVRLLGHVSGATALDDVDFSIHPLQTFTGGETPDVFRDLGVAVAGRTPHAQSIAEALAHALGSVPFTVDPDHRTGYHAAASIASNLLLTVLDAAEQVANAAGLRSPDVRARLLPLVRRTVDNWAADGAGAALTGPIARGDDDTVRRQRGAIAATTPRLTPMFDVLCDATRAVARTHATGTTAA